MEFKYLSESMSLDEARKAYRSLAKQLHPDIGGDEDEFKILAHEYSVIERRASESVIANISDIMEAAGAMVGVIAQTLRELYPRTRVVLNYTSSTIEAEFYGNVLWSGWLPLSRSSILSGTRFLSSCSLSGM